MSASFKLIGSTFPDGTTVKAYPASNWPAPGQPTGAPAGSAAAEGTVSGSSVTFNGLTAGAQYWAGAQIGGSWRYLEFTAGADRAGAAGTAVDNDSTMAGDSEVVAPSQHAAKAALATKQDAATAATDAELGTEETGRKSADTAQAGVWRNLFRVSQNIAGAKTAGTYFIAAGTSGTTIINAGSGTILPQMPIVPSDYALSGKTAKMRLRATVGVSSTPPGVDYTFGLYPLTISGSAYTLGAVVEGSTAKASAPPASKVATAVSSEFAVPAEGIYVFAVVLGGTSASAVDLTASLELHHT